MGVLTVSSIDGRQVGQYEIKEGKNNVTLPETLNTGVYMGRFVSGNKTYIIQLIYRP